MQDFLIRFGTLLGYNGSEANVVIPKGVRKIGACAFEGCDNLQSITIPDSVKKIGRDAFPKHTLEQFDIVGESKWGIMKIEGGVYIFPSCKYATLPKRFRKKLWILFPEASNGIKSHGSIQTGLATIDFTFTDSRVKCKVSLTPAMKSWYESVERAYRAEKWLQKHHKDRA